MDELGLVILQRERTTPSLAMYQRCKTKFFTPRELSANPVKAEEFLRGRFNDHERKLRDFPRRQKRNGFG
jgi:hypothetical protein